MTELTARQIVLAARPQGRPKLTDFRLKAFAIPPLSEGQVLLQVRYLSLDPYMRLPMDEAKSYAEPVAIGEAMTGESVAEVIASRHKDYAEGDVVLAMAGWRPAAVVDGAGLSKVAATPGTPVATRLGVLGMPGFTAYAGLKAIGKPRAGETLVVAAASGPVGSLVGQLARSAGVKAVGIAGGPEKCRFASQDLGFDAAIDHRAPDFPAQLAAACPDGVDIYFENVGGAIWQAVLPLFNQFARVPVCGLIAQYNSAASGDVDQLPATMRANLTKSLTLRGFINYEFTSELYPSFLRDVSAWIAEGRVRYREDIVDGFDNAPEAFIGMLEGRNFGKLIVRVA